MGGIGVASAAAVGTASMLSQARQAKQARKTIKENYNSAYKNRQNLLSKQLASHRANLGSMGITGSASSNAVAQRMVSEGYDDINQDFNTYQNQYSSVVQKQRDDLNRRIADSITATTNQMIK